MSRYINITADGDYDFPPSQAGSEAVKVNGDFGGGSVQLGYMQGSTFIPYTGDLAGPYSDNFDIVLDCGRATRIALSVTGATSPDINAGLSPIGV